MGKIIQIAFKKGQFTYPCREDIIQWDKGLKLQISGLETDKNVQVHFSLEEIQGTAKRVKTEVIDGVIHADIPHFILAKKNCYGMSTYSAYAWIYLTDGDVAETVGEIIFTIKTRAEPEEFVAPEDSSFLEQLEAEVKNKLSKTGHDPNKYLVTDEEGNIVTVDGMETGGDVDLSGYMTKSEHEEALLQFAIKPTTEKAIFHNIQDSADYKVLDFGMDGKTEQETTEGTNLLDLDVEKWTIGKMLTWGASAGTEININTDAIYVAFEIISAKPSTLMSFLNLTTDKYWVNRIIEADDNGLGYVNHRLYDDASTQNKTNYSFTTSANTTKLYVQVRLLDNTQIFTESDLEEMKISVGYGNITTYEPFTNGASPNPDYPQEVVNVGVLNEETGRYEIDVKVTGKNLWNPKSTDYVSGLYTGWKIKDDKSKKVTMTLIDKNNGVDTTGVYFGFTANGINALDRVTWATNGGANDAYKEFRTIVSNFDYVSIYYNKGAFNGLEILLSRFDVMVEYGSVRTEYQPYKEQLITLTSPVPLTKWDKLVTRDGVLGWSIQGELDYEVTGYETFTMANVETYYTGSSTNMYFTPSNMASLNMNDQNVYCTELSFVSSVWIKTDSVGITTNGRQLHMRLPNTLLGVSDDATKEEKISAYKAYLRQRYADGNPVKLQYQAAEEVSFHPLPQEEQDVLNAVMTYYPVTNITNDQDCPMQITYVADTKNYIDNQIASASAATMALALEN